MFILSQRLTEKEQVTLLKKIKLQYCALLCRCSKGAYVVTQRSLLTREALRDKPESVCVGG